MSDLKFDNEKTVVKAKGLVTKQQITGVTVSQAPQGHEFTDPYTIDRYASGVVDEGTGYTSRVVVDGLLGAVVHLRSQAGYVISDFRRKQLQNGEVLEIKAKGDKFVIYKGNRLED